MARPATPRPTATYREYSRRPPRPAAAPPWPAAHGTAAARAWPEPGGRPAATPRRGHARAAESPCGGVKGVRGAEAEAALEQVWAAIRDHYPMLEYVGAIGDEWLEEFRPRVAAAADPWEVIEELVLRLQDYHTRLRRPGPQPLRTHPPVRLGWVEDGLAVLGAEPETGLLPGERILTVDGRTAAEAMAAVWAHSQGSTPEAHRRSACARLVAGPPGSTLTLVSARGAFTLLRPQAPGPLPAVAPVAFAPLPGGVGLLRVRAWGGGLGEDAFTALLDAELEKARPLPQLVVDVRDNGGGADSLADACTGRFLERPVVSSISFWRDPGTSHFRRSVESCRPRGLWRYGGRVALLINEGCASACEHFVSGMDAAGEACLVGTATNGACGWMRRIDLPCGATLTCSMSFPLHGGVPSPLHGIEPHYRVPPRLADLAAGRDAVLETALAWLASGQPLPERRNSAWGAAAGASGPDGPRGAVAPAGDGPDRPWGGAAAGPGAQEHRDAGPPPPPYGRQEQP